MRVAGYTAAECKAAGYTIMQLFHSGKFPLAELRALGATVEEVKAHLVVTLSQVPHLHRISPQPHLNLT